MILVGATTENPFFTINSALVSRSRMFQFEPLSADDIKTLLRRAVADSERGLGQYTIHLHDDALEFLAEMSDGDARRALSALEVGVLSSRESPVEFTRQLAEESVQRKAVQYDRQGDAHYDSISALIKSIRGSDPDAALYWLARMLEGGEDVRFLARRLVILASEDVGNADPAALPLAVAAAQACELVGLPECQLTLAQAVTYLACAPKSNAATVGIGEARARRPRGPAAARAGPSARCALSGGASGWATARAINTPTTRPTRVAAQDYLGVEREYYRPIDRGFERRTGRAAGGDPGAAAGGVAVSQGLQGPPARAPRPFASTGLSTTVKVVPWPSALRTSMRPPISEISMRHSPSPRPVPPLWARVVKNGSKILSKLTRGMPTPVSLTSIATEPIWSSSLLPRA